MDAGELIIKVTYALEGDASLALMNYQKISELRDAIPVIHYPTLKL